MNVNNKEVVELASKNINRLVKLTYIRNFRPDEKNIVITSIRGVDEKHKYIYFGHPFCLNKGKNYYKMTAGEIGVQYDEDYVKIEFLDTSKQYHKNLCKRWGNAYLKFHHSIIREKGYDICQENLIDLTI